MNLQDEYDRLIFLFQQAAENRGSSVQEVFQKALEFIEHLKEQLRSGDENDRNLAVRMMNELYEQMRRHTEAICKRSGLSEEELLLRSENPANYSPETWRMMQESKAQISESGRQLADLLHREDSSSPQISAKSKEPKRKKPKKSDWMRS